MNGCNEQNILDLLEDIQKQIQIAEDAICVANMWIKDMQEEVSRKGVTED